MKITFKDILNIIDYYQTIDVSDIQGKPLYIGNLSEEEDEFEDELLDREVMNIKSFQGHLDIILSKIDEVQHE